MAEPNWENRTLWTGKDNIDVMRGMNSESVDLIYVDPPFSFHATRDAPVGAATPSAGLKNSWTWDDVDPVWLRLLENRAPTLYAILEAARALPGVEMAAYIAMIAPRLQEMRRLLKPTGAIYLQCSDTASFWLRTLMGSMFGVTYRVQLEWNLVSNYDDAGRRNRTSHSLLFYGSKIHRARMLASASSAIPEPNRSTHASQDQVPPDVSTDLPRRHSRAKAPAGLPTNKSLALIRRLLRKTSAETDIVLDPFCAYGTTCVAAEELHRPWVGIDISHHAAELVRLSFQQAADEHGGVPLALGDVIHRTDQPHRTDLSQLPPLATHKSELYGRHNGSCGGCRTHFTDQRHLMVGHIVPRSKGGTDHLSNLWLLCGHCTLVKENTSVEQFIADRMGMSDVKAWLDRE